MLTWWTMPWPGGTTGDLIAKMVLDADLAGNSYWARVDDVLEKIEEEVAEVRQEVESGALGDLSRAEEEMGDLLFAMANCGLPATSGFVGEFMVIMGAVKFNFWLGLLAASALVFGAAYTLWMVKRVYLGPVVNDDVRELSDINAREYLMLALLALAVIVMGVYPKPFTDVMDASVTQLLSHVAQSKLPN